MGILYIEEFIFISLNVDGKFLHVVYLPYIWLRSYNIQKLCQGTFHFGKVWRLSYEKFIESIYERHFIRDIINFVLCLKLYITKHSRKSEVEL